MPLSRHQRGEITFVSQHPLGPKFGHKSVLKPVKCRSSTVHNRWKQSRNFIDSDRTCNESKTGSTNCLAGWTTDIRYNPRQDQRGNDATTCRNHRINCFKWEQRSDWKQVIFSDQTTIRRNYDKQLTYLEEKSSCKLSSASNQSQCL